jgi:hypothetical protein
MRPRVVLRFEGLENEFRTNPLNIVTSSGRNEAKFNPGAVASRAPEGSPLSGRRK